MYYNTPIGILDDNWQPVVPDDPAYLAWLAAGNAPENSGMPTPEQLARRAERLEAHPIAYAYFAAHPAVVEFIRKTPAEQEAEIEAMTLAQLRTVIKFLAVAALVKREFL